MTPYPLTAPEVRPEITNLRKMKTRIEHVVAQDPDGERQVERRVRDDQPLVAVQPAEVLQQRVQRRDHGDRREHRDDQQRHHQGELAPHRQPAERVAGHRPEDQHQRGGDKRHDQRVDEVLAEVVLVERLGIAGAADRVREVLRRAGPDVHRRLEAGGDQPVQRQPDEQHDQECRDVDPVDDPVPAGPIAPAHHEFSFPTWTLNVRSESRQPSSTSSAVVVATAAPVPKCRFWNIAL